MSGLFGGKTTRTSTTASRAAGIQFTTSVFGKSRTLLYGRNKITANLIDYIDFTAIPHTTTTTTKTGKGGSSKTVSSNTTYTYTISFDCGLCEGTATKINAAWIDKSYNATAISGATKGVNYEAIENYTIPSTAPVQIAVKNAAYTVSIDKVVNTDSGLEYVITTDYTIPSQGNLLFNSSLVGKPVIITYTYTAPATVPALFTEFLGTYPTQTPWSYMTNNHPERALGYQGLCHAAAANFDLGASYSIPAISFDVTGLLALNSTGAGGSSPMAYQSLTQVRNVEPNGSSAITRLVSDGGTYIYFVNETFGLSRMDAAGSITAMAGSSGWGLESKMVYFNDEIFAISGQRTIHKYNITSGIQTSHDMGATAGNPETLRDIEYDSTYGVLMFSLSGIINADIVSYMTLTPDLSTQVNITEIWGGTSRGFNSFAIIGAKIYGIRYSSSNNHKDVAEYDFVGAPITGIANHVAHDMTYPLHQIITDGTDLFFSYDTIYAPVGQRVKITKVNTSFTTLWEIDMPDDVSKMAIIGAYLYVTHSTSISSVQISDGAIVTTIDFSVGFPDLNASGDIAGLGTDVYCTLMDIPVLIVDNNIEYISKLTEEGGAGGGSGYTIYDADPKEILRDFLSNTTYGVGFLASNIDTLTQYSNYCIANSILLSPAYEEQEKSADTVKRLMLITNSDIYMSEGILKVTPRGSEAITGNNVTFTPDVTAKYDLTEDDFCPSEGEDPVIVRRKNRKDAFNSVTIEYINKANEYNVETTTAQDLEAIEKYGLREFPVVKAYEITNSSLARFVSQLILQRQLYTMNEYEFQVTWKYCLLEPTDYITLTDPETDLNSTPVRITEITDNNDSGKITIIAEDAPPGISNAIKTNTQVTGGTVAVTGELAGNINTPLIFEPPIDLLSGTKIELWIGASGLPNVFAGAEIWASEDDSTFNKIGSILNPCKDGVLTTTLPIGLDPDTVNSFSVNMTRSEGVLNGGSQENADNFNTLSIINDELISFQDVTLDSPNNYTIGTYIRRGAYQTTIAAHNIGDDFYRLDGAIFTQAVNNDRIGTTIYLKFPTYNVFGNALQNLTDLPSYPYLITGSAFTAPLDPVLNLISVIENNIAVLKWDRVSDPIRTVTYEIRKGSSWELGNVVGNVTDTKFQTVGNGTYWVSGKAEGTNYVTYSSTPAGI